jgi:hypothetical protein
MLGPYSNPLIKNKHRITELPKLESFGYQSRKSIHYQSAM